MLQTMQRKFSKLPLKGKVKDQQRYWSSDYWPLNKGGIAFRWNSPAPQGFNLSSPDLREALRMSQTELAWLSPAEKFDLFRGDYKYSLKMEVGKRARPSRKDWEGICHGWAAAALNHNEPVARIVSNPDGLLIPFGSSDIKALLSYFYAYHNRASSTHQTGRRCNGTQYCQDDLNAGAFHLILSNRLGLERKGFILDIENGREVWNQVAFDYESRLIQKNLSPSPTSAPGTVKVHRLRTHLRVVFNIVSNSWTPVIGTPLQTYKDLEYEYDIDLNQQGEIIGGDWVSTDRPDFLWSVAQAAEFSPMFLKLKRLLLD
jgi:hypothetical protein